MKEKTNLRPERSKKFNR